MSAALIDSSGKVRILDSKAGAAEVVTEDDVQEPAKLARILVRLLAVVGAMSRAFAPKRIDYEDLTVSTGGAIVQLQHNFGGRVRWWVVGWQSAGTASPIFVESTALTTSSTLVLASYVAGTATIRVENAG